MRKRIVVVGLGHFGSWVARALYQQGHEVIAIDRDADLVDRYAGELTRGVVGDGTDRELLEQVGAQSADAAVVSTGGDLAASALTALALSDLGVADIHVKVTSRSASRVLEALGVKETIFPEREVALRLGHRLTSKTVLEYIPLGDGYCIQEIAVPDEWLGKTLRELGLPRKHGIQIVAIHDVLTGRLNVVPDPDQPLRDSDVAVVVGEERKLAEVLERAARES